MCWLEPARREEASIGIATRQTHHNMLPVAFEAQPPEGRP